MYDHIVSAGSLKNVETRVATTLDQALQALADLDHLRSKAGLPKAERPFLLGAEHRIAVAEAVAEAKEDIPAWRRPSRRDAEPPSRPIGGQPLTDPLTALRAALATVTCPDLTAEDFSSPAHKKSLLYRVLLIWAQSGGAHDPGVWDRVC
jgi:hypothetical protein